MILRDPFPPFPWSYAINLFLFYCITSCDPFFAWFCAINIPILLFYAINLTMLFGSTRRYSNTIWFSSINTLYYNSTRLSSTTSWISAINTLLLFYAINLSILFVSTRLSSPTLWFCGIDPLIVFGYVRFTPFYTLWSHARKPSSPILWFCVFHLFLFFGPTRFSLFYLINMRLICDEYMQVYFFLKLCNILLLSML